ncbi:MAG: MoaD/ThiS family protein [Bacteroidota bacterium]
MRVFIPSVLRSYTGEGSVAADGATLGEVLTDLDRRFPGLRFRIVDEQDRIRRHVRFFVNGEQTFELGYRLSAQDEIYIVQALSGG